MGIIEKVEAARLKEGRPDLRPGDTVEVLVRVIEGDKERQQKFVGDVINVRGVGLRKSFTLRKISEGVGVERTFPLHGPAIAEIKVLRHSKIRRAKLYYLRGKTGKAARLSEHRTQQQGEPATK
jgi:large subunit ribosomal protein L19